MQSGLRCYSRIYEQEVPEMGLGLGFRGLPLLFKDDRIGPPRYHRYRDPRLRLVRVC